VPYPLRLGIAYDPTMLRAVLGIATHALMRSCQQRAAAQLGAPGGQSGSVTLILRFGGAVNPNVHLHVLVLDGVYSARAESPGELFNDRVEI
jgi:hypothetical protein